MSTKYQEFFSTLFVKQPVFSLFLILSRCADARSYHIWKAPGGTPYNDLYGEAPPKRGIFFRLQVYERVDITLDELYKRVGKSDIWVFERA